MHLKWLLTGATGLALFAASAPARAQQIASPQGTTTSQTTTANQGAAAAPADAGAQALRAEVERLRQEFEALKQQYGERLAALEARLATLPDAPTTSAGAPPSQPSQPAAETAGAGAQPPSAAQGAPPATQAAPAAAAVPSGAAGGGGPEGQLPVYGNTSSRSKVFNPDMAVIGNFVGAAGRNEVAPSPALDMQEAEVSFQAIVDPYARGDFFVSFGPDGTVDLEEGFLTLTSLPGGFLAKVGKLHGAFGKVNQMHSHVLPWTDRPLVTMNLVGGDEGVTDSGISVSRLIPSRVVFLEATGEVYRGESALFQAPSAGDLTYVARLRGYQDLGEASNIDLGTSFAFGHNGVTDASTTSLFGFDATFRYRPLRRAIYRRFLARTEMVWSRRSELAGEPQSFGTYVSGEYQFARRWVAGVRFDYSDRATNPALTDKGGSVLLTFWPSEFSQVRGQYRRTRYAEGQTANEFLFQFLFSIGAHGAHAF